MCKPSPSSNDNFKVNPSPINTYPNTRTLREHTYHDKFSSNAQMPADFAWLALVCIFLIWNKPKQPNISQCGFIFKLLRLKCSSFLQIKSSAKIPNVSVLLFRDWVFLVLWFAIYRQIAKLYIHFLKHCLQTHVSVCVYSDRELPVPVYHSCVRRSPNSALLRILYLFIYFSFPAFFFAAVFRVYIVNSNVPFARYFELTARLSQKYSYRENQLELDLELFAYVYVSHYIQINEAKEK